MKGWKNGALLLIFVLLLSYSLVNFMIGLRNIDLAYNMRKMEVEFNTSLRDATSYEEKLTPDELYHLGNAQIQQYGSLVIASLLFIGFLLNNLVRRT